ncbi:PspC domain-containing protein [bacterium]|nr:PspC domain-containing protein [Candidatus Elulimicrobium humile]
MVTTSKRSLYKSTEFRVFTGVAAGIADYINTNHNLIRLLFVLLTLASGIGLVFYITLSILLPTEDEIIEQEDKEFYYKVTHGGLKEEDMISAAKYSDMIDKLASKQNIIALMTMFIGMFFLQFRLAPWESIPEGWRYPAIVVTIGLGLLLKSVTQKKL